MKRKWRFMQAAALTAAVSVIVTACADAAVQQPEAEPVHMEYPAAAEPSDHSVLPVLRIETEGDIGNDYTDVQIVLTDDVGGTDSDLLYDGTGQIKLRGNSTRYREKKPYKLKLDEASDLFGMGENKHWVLLANDIDHTLIRNRITLDFARSIGLETASRSRFVSLYLGEAYQGVYQLTEHVRVGRNRVDIYDWKDTFGRDAPLPAAEVDAAAPQTGGFLLEADFYAFADRDISKLITKFQQPFYFNKPEYVDEDTDLYRYAKNYIQSFEYALHAPDYTYHADGTHYEAYGVRFMGLQGWKGHLVETLYNDPTFDGYHYSELFDMDSLIDYLLVCEVSMNWDSMKNSVFLYKDIDGVAYMGPPWDYDWAYGNINMYNMFTNVPEGWQTTNDYFTNEQYYQSVQWNRYLIRDPYFLMRLYQRYHEIRDVQLADLMDAVDAYEAYLRFDGKRNDARWEYTYNEWYYGGAQPEHYTDAYASLRTFLKTRVAWLDAQFADLDTLIASFGAYQPSEEVQITDGGSRLFGGWIVQVTCDLETAASYELQINGTERITVEKQSGTQEIALPDAVLQDGENLVQIRPLDEAGMYLYDSSEPEALPISAYVQITR